MSNGNFKFVQINMKHLLYEKKDWIENSLEKLETPFHHFKASHSRAADAVVSGSIWTEFKLMQDSMPLLIACKDRINSNQRSGDIDFLDAQGSLTPQSIVISGRNSNSPKLLYMS